MKTLLQVLKEKSIESFVLTIDKETDKIIGTVGYTKHKNRKFNYEDAFDLNNLNNVIKSFLLPCLCKSIKSNYDTISFKINNKDEWMAVYSIFKEEIIRIDADALHNEDDINQFITDWFDKNGAITSFVSSKILRNSFIDTFNDHQISYDINIKYEGSNYERDAAIVNLVEVNRVNDDGVGSGNNINNGNIVIDCDKAVTDELNMIADQLVHFLDDGFSNGLGGGGFITINIGSEGVRLMNYDRFYYHNQFIFQDNYLVDPKVILKIMNTIPVHHYKLANSSLNDFDFNGAVDSLKNEELLGIKVSHRSNNDQIDGFNWDEHQESIEKCILEYSDQEEQEDSINLR